jgi:hypothetical protein
MGAPLLRRRVTARALERTRRFQKAPKGYLKQIIIIIIITLLLVRVLVAVIMAVVVVVVVTVLV